MSLVAILNETFENEPAGTVKKEMKKKILIAIFFGAIMLLVPFTAIAGEADVRAVRIEEQKEENFLTSSEYKIKFSEKEYNEIINDFRDLLEEKHPVLYEAVKQAFDNAVTKYENRYNKIINDFKDLLEKRHPILYKIVKKAFGNVVTKCNDDVYMLDLEKFKSGITLETSYELLQVLQQMVGTSVMDIYKDVGSLGEPLPVQQTAGSNLPATATGNNAPGVDGLMPEETVGSSVPAMSYNNGDGGFDLYADAEKQTAIALPIGNGDGPTWEDEDIEAKGKHRWETYLRPVLISFTGHYWPVWREDNDGYDHDGPLQADEENQSRKDNLTTGEKYSHMGLDDYMDWNILATLLWFLPYAMFATFLFIFILIKVGIELACLIWEAFDVKDLPYAYIPPDGR